MTTRKLLPPLRVTGQVPDARGGRRPGFLGWTFSAAIVCLVWLAALRASAATVELVDFDRACGVTVKHDETSLRATWPTSESESAEFVLSLDESAPLVRSLALRATGSDPWQPLIQSADPVLLLTVGQRDLSKKDGWTVFFDSPYKRPHETFRGTLDKRALVVSSHGKRATIRVDGLEAGPFRGGYSFTIYPNTDLLRLEAVLSTTRNACAIAYDLGFTLTDSPRQQVVYLDNHDRLGREPLKAETTATSLAVRYRALVLESAPGALAIIAPPHQFLSPLDSAGNFGLVWRGSNWRDLVSSWSLGICQPREGDKRFVPWINAPPGTEQRLGAFCAMSATSAEDCLERVRRYTHDDRYRKLPGYHTFTSHYHIEHTLAYEKAQAAEATQDVPRSLERPPFVAAFKRLGVDIVHLAEFHVGRSPEFFARRLARLELMHRECQRLSDDELLVLPGEEPNAHLGGHWISLFPKPLYWTFERAANEPFVEDVAPYGKVYRVATAADVLRMMEQEHGLMWTAHPRIKSSLGFPDAYRGEPFYRSNRFLGATWKAMPADLSLARLGTRCLDLLDDMANWGQRKYILGEVDVFQVRPEFELYGHANVNYLQLDHVPRYTDGWPGILDVLRNGRFFVTTGEIVIPSFRIGGKQSGETLQRSDAVTTDLDATIEWTFPLAYAEIVSGDGIHVVRHRIDLSDTRGFGHRTLHLPVKLTGRKWARLEVWDVAANGAFTQPVWLE